MVEPLTGEGRGGGGRGAKESPVVQDEGPVTITTSVPGKSQQAESVWNVVHREPLGSLFLSSHARFPRSVLIYREHTGQALP